MESILSMEFDVIIFLDDVIMCKGIIFFIDYVWDIYGIYVIIVR